MNGESPNGRKSKDGRGRLKPRPREGAVEQDLINRFSRAEGQLRGIRKMIEEQAYCIDVLQQISAARRALDKAALILLRDHLKTCVTDALHAGDSHGHGGGADKINEVIDALDRFLA
jgi:DNA-binding FrmR family transcriptional regulator